MTKVSREQATISLEGGGAGGERPLTVDSLSYRINSVAQQLEAQRPDLFGSDTQLGKGLRTKAEILGSQVAQIEPEAAQRAEATRAERVRGWVNDVKVGVEHAKKSRGSGDGQLVISLRTGNGGVEQVSPEHMPMRPRQFAVALEATGPESAELKSLPRDAFEWYKQQHEHFLNILLTRSQEELTQLGLASERNNEAVHTVADGLTRFFLGEINQTLAQIEAQIAKGVPQKMGRLGVGRGQDTSGLMSLVEKLANSESLLARLDGQLAGIFEGVGLIPRSSDARVLLQAAVNQYGNGLDGVLRRVIRDMDAHRRAKAGRTSGYSHLLAESTSLTNEVAKEIMDLVEAGVPPQKARRELLRKYHPEGSEPNPAKYSEVAALT